MSNSGSWLNLSYIKATDISGTVSDIQKAVQDTPAGSPLRIFCLGIGNGVSSAMCEAIARAGNGVCLFAVHIESILGQCAKLFRAGRTPFVRNVTVDWGVPDDMLSPGTPSVNFSTPDLDLGRVQLRPPPIVQQSPTVIHEIHSGTRMNVFVILRLKGPNAPKTVVLRGQLDGDSDVEAFEMTVPIRAVQLTDSEPGVPLVHTLAAWRLIQDHDERTALLPAAFGVATDEELRKAAIIRLGKKYQLASKYTSFICVDSRGRDIRERRNEQTSRRRSRSPDSHFTDSQATTGSAAGLTLQGLVSQMSDSMPGAWRWSATESHSGSLSPTTEHQSDGHDEGYDSAETFSTLSSLEGSSAWSDWSDDPPPLSEEDLQMQRSPSPLLRANVRLHRAPVQTGTDAPAPPVKTEVVRLARLQSFDGSFSLDDDLRQLVGDEAVAKGSELQVDEKVWATALFVAFMSKHMGDQKDLLDDLCVKAYEFLAGQQDSQRLVQQALEVVK